MELQDIKTMFLPTPIYPVDKKLSRGNAVFLPSKMLKLKKQQITQIIDLRDDNKKSTTFLKNLEKFYCKCFGIKYENIPFSIADKYVPEKDIFEKINSQIINNDGKTYLHCHFGKHRTNMGVAMYEKSLGKPEEIIFNNLIKNFCSGETIKSSKYRKIKKSLDIFLKEFFPKFI